MIPKAVAAMAAGLVLFPCPLLSRKSSEPAAQEKPAANKQASASTVVSSAALRMGAALESAAPAPVMKWARSYSRREMLKSTPPTEGGVAAALLTNYPGAPAAAREAGEFLLWYVAYREGTKSQEIAAQRVREIERDIDFLNGDLRNIRNTPVEISQAGVARAAEDRAMARLQDAERMRDMHKRVRDAVAARVDVCIERLAALGESRKDRDAAEIRNLK